MSDNFTGFPPQATEFFRGLAADNSRAYFHANKPVFEAAVRTPMADLLEDAAPEFGDFRMFRMNRDTRFAADKSPYKEMLGAASLRGSTTTYLHIGAAGVMAAAGMYVMAPDQITRYRDGVASQAGQEFRDILADLDRAGFALGHGAHAPLKRVPRGYDADHLAGQPDQGTIRRLTA